LAAKVQGTVVLEILVGTDGKVKDAQILRTANPLFDESAVDAVRRWEFTPALVNGVPTPIVLLAELDFNLR
jgi:protein TonB